MKHKAHIILSALVTMATLVACQSQEPQLNTREDTLSWAMGVDIARSLTEYADPGIDKAIVMQAIQHTLDGASQPLDDSTLRVALLQLTDRRQIAKMQEDNRQQANIDRQQELYFDRLVADHPNVKRHPAGFYYEVVREGTGRQIKEGDRLSFDYRSYLMLTGEPYDQTYGKRQPILHVVGRPMFEGLVMGMQLMRAGSLYRFYFPYQLAFGAQGAGDIPGFTPFIYEIEIHEVFDK